MTSKVEEAFLMLCLLAKAQSEALITDNLIKGLETYRNSGFLVDRKPIRELILMKIKLEGRVDKMNYKEITEMVTKEKMSYDLSNNFQMSVN